MRILTPLILLLAFLSGCSSYQYLTVDSPQVQKNPQHQLTWENDTLRIIYAFNGYGGPLRISIYNKTTQPLYVNWKKSAIIRDQRSIALYDPQVNFSGSTDGAGYRLGRNVNTSSTFSGSFDLPDGVDFIPPSSSISKGLLSLLRTGPLLIHIPDSIHQQAITQNNGFKIRYKEVTLDEVQSLIRFRSYFTFVLGLNNGREFAETQSFYVRKVVETSEAPEFLDMYKGHADQLFIRQSH